MLYFLIIDWSVWLLQDLTFKQKYLVTFTVGYRQKDNIDAAVKKVKPNLCSLLSVFTSFCSQVLYSLFMRLFLPLLQFSDDFTIMLFHYDGLTTEWDEFEWSKRAIHVSAPKQTKWWGSITKVLDLFRLFNSAYTSFLSIASYVPLILCSRWYAKRFLHPDIVAPYEYIFIWDEDLGLEHFNADKWVFWTDKIFCFLSWGNLKCYSIWSWEFCIFVVNHRYIKLARKHGLEISQPGLEKTKKFTWPMTRRIVGGEVHKYVEKKCSQSFSHFVCL